MKIINKDIKIVQSEHGDWAGLYINDELQFDDHEITCFDILNALQIPYKKLTAEQAWIELAGHLPGSFRDCKIIK